MEHLYLPGNSNNHRHFEEVLVKLYASVLKYLTRAGMFFESNAAKRLMYSTFRRSDLDDIVRTVIREDASVEAFRSLMDVQRQMDTSSLVSRLNHRSSNVDQSLKDLSTSHVKLEQLFNQTYQRSVDRIDAFLASLDDSRRKLLDWLSVVPHHQHHETFRSDLLPGLGDWLILTTEFLEWHTSSSSDIFWLHGIPGCGKTRLTARVIEALRTGQQTANHPAPIAYFYCSRDPAEPERASPQQILGSIVKQISCPEAGGLIFQGTQNKYEQKRILASSNESSLASIEIEECQEILLEAALATPFTIVLDALDECDPTQRYLLFKVLQEVVVRSVNVVKIFISSREEDDIAAIASITTNFEVTPKHNQSDINVFVSTRVREAIQQGRIAHGIDPAKFEQKVIDSLVLNAHGMFQWAKLQIELLCDRRKIRFVGDVMKALQEAPLTLIESYRILYDQIDRLERNGRLIAKKVLTWMIGAQRTLSPEEVMALFARDQDFTETIDWVTDITITTVLSCCYSLIYVDRKMGILRFSHPSVREFLETLDEHKPDAVHSAIARRCLNSFIYDDTAGNDRLLLEFLLEKEYFHDCLDESQKVLRTLDHGGDLFKKVHAMISDPVTPLFAISCFGLTEVYDEDSTQDLDLKLLNIHGTSCLYLAARWGYITLVEYYLNHGVHTDIAGGQFGSSIQAASFAGHIHIVQLLLTRGAYLFTKGEFPDAIQAALAGGHTDIAQTLLQAGYKGGRGASLESILQFALFGGHVQIVRLLAKHIGGNLDLEETALQTALFHGKRRQAKSLIENGADINAQGGLFGNALQAAVFSGSLSLVELVVSHGAHIEERGRFGSALRAAAATGQTYIAKWLLEKGSPCNARDNQLGDCLQAAAWKGNVEILSQLLSHGSEPDGWQGFFGSPVQAAAFNGHVEAVALLISKGASIELAGRFPNALHAALHGNKPEVVQILIENGARLEPHLKPYFGFSGPVCVGGFGGAFSSDKPRQPLPNLDTLLCPEYSPIHASALQVATWIGNLDLLRVCWEDFGSPLQVVSERGNLLAVRFLVICGANVNHDGGTNGTALQVAAGAGHLLIVQYLIDHGANVNAVGKERGSALQAASERGYLEVVRLLLTNGADLEVIGNGRGTALCLAAGGGQADVVRLLLQSGADINACEENGPWPAIFKAASVGDNGVMRVLLEFGANLNGLQTGLEVTQYNDVMLYACRAGETEAVRYLLEKGLSPITSGIIESSVSDISSHHMEQHECKKILKSWEGYENCPLYVASHFGRSEILELLINAGGNVNYVNTNGIGPLDVAIHAVHFQAPLEELQPQSRDISKVLKVLIGAGATTHHSRPYATGCLLEQISQHGDIDLLQLLELRFPSLIPPRDSLEIHGVLAAAIEFDHAETTRSLFISILVSRLKSTAWESYLKSASEYGPIEILEYLISVGTEPAQISIQFISDLHGAACKKGYLKTAGLLLRRFPMLTLHALNAALRTCSSIHSAKLVLFYIEERGRQGNGQSQRATRLSLGQVLVRAIRICATKTLATDLVAHDLAIFVVGRGAALNIRDEWGETPLYIASKFGFIRILSALIDARVRVNFKAGEHATALQVAVVEGRWHTIERLLEAGANPNLAGGVHGPPLSAAAGRHSESSLLGYRWPQGANYGPPNQQDVNNFNYRRGNIATVSLLLAHGARVNTVPEAIGPWGSALQAAIYGGHSLPVELLLQHGANVNAKGGILGSPLHAAAYKGRTDHVRLLLDHGAYVNQRAGHFGSVLEAAQWSCNTSTRDDMKQILLAAGAEMVCGAGAQTKPELPNDSEM
ncbi:hypothetical protein MMC25_001166 [Agyrium rufum]|nr:hypothetical protein [Agyrium rufum]